jgi:6-phosphogluconolactonase (cycloisomerase 2 family)
LLTFVEVEKNGVDGISGLGGAYGVTLSPDARHLYVPSIADNAVALFRRNTQTGRLSFVEALADGVDGVDGLSIAFDTAIAPDGSRLYVASYGDNAVTVLNREESTGRLTVAEIERDGTSGLDGLALADAVQLSPDGRHLYAAGFGDDAIVVFSVPSVALYLPQVNRHR